MPVKPLSIGISPQEMPPIFNQTVGGATTVTRATDGGFFAESTMKDINNILSKVTSKRQIPKAIKQLEVMTYAGNTHAPWYQQAIRKLTGIHESPVLDFVPLNRFQNVQDNMLHNLLGELYKGQSGKVSPIL